VALARRRRHGLTDAVAPVPVPASRLVIQRRCGKLGASRHHRAYGIYTALHQPVRRSCSGTRSGLEPLVRGWSRA
jgi:hypothetical protein